MTPCRVPVIFFQGKLLHQGYSRAQEVKGVVGPLKSNGSDIIGLTAVCWTMALLIFKQPGPWRRGWGHYVLWRRVCTICREGRGGGHFKLHFTRLCTLLDSLFKTIAEFESQEAALDFSRGRGPGVGRRGGLRRRGRGE